MAKVQHVEVGAIRTEGLQTRAAIDADVVREYAEAEQERGAVLPPVVVFLDGTGAYWLADGFHRLAVARQNGRKKVACDVREGSRVDALRFALGANGAHGLRRTNADKAHAVKVAYEHRIELGLGEVPSARAVAEMVGIDHKTATFQLGNFPSWREAVERVGADGKVRVLPPVPERKPTENAKNKAAGETAKGADLPPPPVRASREGAREEETACPEDCAPPWDGPKTEGAALSPTPVRTGGRAEHGSEGLEDDGQECPSAATSGGMSVLPPLPVRPAGMRDGRGRPVPPELAALWNRRSECAELAALVSRVRVALRKAQEGDDPLWAEINHSSVQGHLDQAYSAITAAEPWCVCPMCQGIGCKACKGRGLMGEYRCRMVVPRGMR